MIYIPKISGTCPGSMNAINTALRVLEVEKKKKNRKKIYILKEILHNEAVIQNLHTNGIDCVDNLEKIDKNSIVIIRAHGESKEVYEFLNSKKIEYYDATCKNVKKIHDTVDKKSNEGYQILIIGKKTHPEVIGTLGWCNGKGIVIETKDNAKNIKLTNKKVIIVSQTTIDKDTFDSISSILTKNNKYIEVLNTICGAQSAIQLSSYELATKMDYMFVIGGKSSSNTEVLFQKCNSVCKSYKYSKIEEFFEFIMHSEDITENTNIGITGGASTPYYQLEEYKDLLNFVIFYKKMKLIFNEHMNRINTSFKNKKDNKIVKDVINNFIDINKDGKYIRASLIALGYKMNSKKSDNYFLDLALAYETFQTSILVHDDIIDNAVIRRNKATIPYRYMNSLKSNTKNKIEFESDKKHLSDSIGICAGDLGFYLANKIILEKYSKDKNLVNILEFYNTIVINTIKGEMIDVILPFNQKYSISDSTEKDVFEIYNLKTSWYTIIGPFILGMLLDGKNKNIKEMENILNNIGIAFQIKDDILGIFSDETELGKSNISDILEYKQTILYSYVSHCQKYRKSINKYYGKKNITLEELNKIKDIFIKSGALEYANSTMNTLFDKSKEQIINSNEIDLKTKSILLGLIIYLKIRNK